MDPVNFDCENQSNSQSCKESKLCKWLASQKLFVVTLIGIAAGFILGFSLRTCSLTPQEIMWISIAGEIFIRTIKMIMLPVVTCGIIVGVSSLQPKTGGKLGALTLVYILITHMIACLISGLLTFVIRPGVTPSDGPIVAQQAVVNETEKNGELAYLYDDAIADMLRNMFPENIVMASFSHSKMSKIRVNGLITTKTEHLDGPSMIGLAIFSFAFGLGIIATGEIAVPVRNLIVGLYKVFVKILMVITWFGPIGIMSLIASAIIQADDLLILVETFGMLTLTFVASLAVHQLIFLPPVLVVIVRKNPFRYLWALRDSLVAAVAASSSVVALPHLFKACEKRMKVDSRIVQFVLPVTVAMNAPGSVMFIVMGVFFMAQTYGIVLDASAIIMTGILSTVLGTSIGGAPYTSLVSMVLLATSLDLPVTSGMIGLFYSIDWLLDRLKATSNIFSQGCCPGIMEKLIDIENSLNENNIDQNENNVDQKETNQEATSLGETSSARSASIDEGIYCHGGEEKDIHEGDVHVTMTV